VKLSLANKLFQYREPVPRLQDSDQKLLLAALSGLTDEELSHKLHLSLASVKKRWISVFERTIYSRPDLFPEADDRNDGAKRGSQKRHHVLAYMRAILGTATHRATIPHRRHADMTACYFAFGFTISDNKSGREASRTRCG
jgi:hypothetical protein